VFKFGLATIVVRQRPVQAEHLDPGRPALRHRRRAARLGFTIFYMGINAGAFLAPLLTGWLANTVFGSEGMPAYKFVFIASGVGMLISLVWFYLGRSQLQGHRRAGPGAPRASTGCSS
jgi:POT family proton-dependent oligopeptide transporter